MKGEIMNETEVKELIEKAHQSLNTGTGENLATCLSPSSVQKSD